MGGGCVTRGTEMFYTIWSNIDFETIINTLFTVITIHFFSIETFLFLQHHHYRHSASFAQLHVEHRPSQTKHEPFFTTNLNFNKNVSSILKEIIVHF